MKFYTMYTSIPVYEEWTITLVKPEGMYDVYYIDVCDETHESTILYTWQSRYCFIV